ncbi:CocE/NonD family hydrolase [Mangrovicoccus sp. HB161399]|uniref:CocE/NonD family hydrolase n=1 Tax=Mangrovicoccus sp. HB161399 TaxID=2720392 RepID=UPI001555172E|nr:CocE/NonD family hydrolase [Mangrovicoccus sp. HB161399]
MTLDLTPAFDPHMAPAELPPAAGVQPVETLSMATADGTRLDADIWRPEGDGPWPVLLQRQAYGRRIGCTICYAHPAWYAAQGYMVVVQDVRGRGTSEGRFWPGQHEAADGAEAVEWAARLPGSDGRVAMYGFSYQAYDQLLAATADSPSLAALIPAMGPWDPARTWIFGGGAFKLGQMAGWGTQITVEGARRAGDAAAYARLKAGAASLFSGEVPGHPAELMASGEFGHYPGWVSRGADDPYWQSISPAASLARLRERRLPMFFIGGWFDGHLHSTLEAFAALDRADDPTMRLMVGPWIHFPWERRAAGVDFGPEAAADTDRAQVAFLDAVLKGKGTLAAEDRVQLFDLGQRTWRSHGAMPETAAPAFLAGSGRAATRIGDGTLADGPAPGTELMVHDPWRAAPSAGPGAGPVDRRATDERSDVMTFASLPQAAPVTVEGPLRLHLDISADRPSFDVSATLSILRADGRAHAIAESYLHLRARPEGPVSLDLGATCVTLAPGEALRLSIAAAAFPAHAVNPGTGADPVAAPLASALITTLHLALGEDSRLDLPVADGVLQLR